MIDLRLLRAILAVRNPLQFWFRALVLFGALLWQILKSETLQRSPHFTAALFTVAALIALTMVGFAIESVRTGSN